MTAATETTETTETTTDHTAAPTQASPTTASSADRNQPPRTTDARPAPTPAPADPAPERGAVIAIPTRDGFQGRYLHHAPGPAATVELLCALFAARYPGRRGYERAVRELISEHPSGWARLGCATSKDKQIKPRRAPAPVGECYCHRADGTPHPALIAAALATLHEAEIWESGAVRIPHGELGDGSPYRIHSSVVPDGIDYAYVLYREALVVKARDGAYPKTSRFEWAIGVDWHRPPQGEAIEQACAAIRARTPANLANEHAADILANTARKLAQIPAHHDLVLHLLAGASRYLNVPAEATPEAALARAAGLHPAQLPGHLHLLERGEQVRLLQQAAYQLNPVKHATA